MKASLKAGASLGFTIVEVMIVLAVSGMILISAILVFSGQQGQTEFSQAINQFQTQLQATINDAANGYYPTSSSYNFTCSPGSRQPVFSTGSNAQGTNNGCIFLGKVMQFAVSSSGDTKSPLIDIYTIVGEQNVPGTSTPAQSVYDSFPVVLANSGHRNINFPPPAIYTLENRSYIKCIETSSVYDPSKCDSSHSPTGAVAFAINSTGPPIFTPEGNQEVTASTVIPLPLVTLGSPKSVTTVQHINTALDNISSGITGVSICLIDNTRAGIIYVGGNNSQAIVNVSIVRINSSGVCS